MSDNAVQDSQVEQSQDQANPEIQDQANVSQEQGEQPIVDSPQPEEQLIEVNGEKVPLSELQAGYMRQQDYTRKTQELAEKQRQLARMPNGDPAPSQELDPQAKAFIEALREKGQFMTKKDYQDYLAAQEDDRKLAKILDENPHLKPFEKSIRAAGEKDPRAWEDILRDPEWGFNRIKPTDKPVRGVEGRAPSMAKDGPKSIEDMNESEWEAHKRKTLRGSTLI